MSVSIPPSHVPSGMKAVHVGSPFLAKTLEELASFGSKRVFVLANESSRKFLEGDGEDRLVGALASRGVLAAPLCTSVGMNGGEGGLLRACDAARAAGADAVVTVGGGAVQDAGKLVRLWLSAGDDREKASVAGIRAAAGRDPLPALAPQVAVPNSFAMAEATHVAGLTTRAGTKGGAAHAALMPTVVVYDPALSAGLPDWVRFGTAFRGVEHAVGAATHPDADEDVRSRALEGLEIIRENLAKLVDDPECPTLQSNLYVGGFIAIRALNTGCYPALGHLIQNHYSAKFDVHQGACSGMLCARIMAHHLPESGEHQKRIAAALGDETVPAPRLVRDLAATLPGVKREHAHVGVEDDKLREFAKQMFDSSAARYNRLSPREFASEDELYQMMTIPLEKL